MDKHWTIIYYTDKESNSEISDFLDTLDDTETAKIFSWIEKLEELGPLLPRPYADLLEDGIHELRIKISGSQIRVIYFFCYEKYIVLTHAFTKNSNEVPVKEIKKAKKMRDDFKTRFSKEDLKEVT